MKVLALLVIGVVPLSCTPLRDLDAASRGGLTGASAEPTSSAATSGANSGTASGTGSSSGTASPAAVSANSTVPSVSASSPNISATSSTSLANSVSSSQTSAPAGSSASGTVGDGAPTSSATLDADAATPLSSSDASGTGFVPGQDAPELPLDLPANPVSGTFFVSSEAVWEVESGNESTFEIKTPTASYWVVKPLGMIVSIQAADTEEPSQWIGYSSSFRPDRGLPSFSTFGATDPMTTTLDEVSQTLTHVRLNAATASGGWRLVYDFYPTHVTITVNAAPVPYGFAFRGVIAGTLEETDCFGIAGGSPQSAVLSSITDWGGASEWVYMSDPVLDRSLFMIQHIGDTLVDRYQVRDTDSALISFGDGNLTQLPQRFSIGLINSATAADVAERAAFVVGAIE